MPIKDPSLYPKDWKEIRTELLIRSGEMCECSGLCGVHGPHNSRECFEVHHEPAKNFKGIVVLTIAHLCFDPPCKDRMHLRALCQRCHNRYDNSHRMRNARKTREAKSKQERFA